MHERQIKLIILTVIGILLLLLFFFTANPNGIDDLIERQKERARQKQTEMYRNGKYVP